MATEKWIAGAQASWATAFTTAPGALTAGQAIMSDLPIDNATNLDMFAELSIHLGSFTPIAPNFVGVYIFPLNYGAPGTIYGPSIAGAQGFSSAAAGPPPSFYWVGNIVIPVQTSQVADGILTNIVLPPVKFSFALYNGCGATWNATNVCQYRTYNRSVA